MDQASVKYLIDCAICAGTYLLIDFITSPHPVVTVWWNYFTAKAPIVDDIEDEYSDL